MRLILVNRSVRRRALPTPPMTHLCSKRYREAFVTAFES
jgi:hypothetical protein